ncbi:MAG: carboxylate-amine ligase [Gemmataceae bacterium]
MKTPSLTLGVEEEYQIIDPQTRELKPYITQLLEDSRHTLGDQLKAELHQSMVEVGTEVCATPAEVRRELVRLRGEVMGMAGRSGLKIAAAGTHPFSSWTDQEITPFERYLGLKQDMQDLAQQLLIFGTHVHVGIEDRDFLIDAMNVARYFVPHVLCLSASSPYWMGRHTGLASYRSIIFRHFPRTGIPPLFDSWASFDNLVQTLVRTNSIPDPSKLWWDLRPNWKYPTLEFRACDVCTRVDEAVCIAAIFQALIAKLWKLRRDNVTFRVYPMSLIEENKWRAVRYGLDGKLLDLGKQEEIPIHDLIHELIESFLADVIDELGTRREIEYAFTILEQGNSASRQVAEFTRSGSLHSVVDQLIRETEEGVVAP